MNIPTPTFAPLGSHWAMQLIMNFVSLLGVIFFDWSVFALFYFFYLETVAISFFDGLKILYAEGDEDKGPHIVPAFRFLFFRFFILAFYMVFIIVFVGILISGQQGKGYEWAQYFMLMVPSFKITVYSLLALQLFDFIFFYMIKKQREHTTVASLNQFFNARIVIIHVVIILGAFTFQYFGDKFGSRYGIIGFATVFVLFKILVDFFLYAIDSKKINNS